MGILKMSNSQETIFIDNQLVDLNNLTVEKIQELIDKLNEKLSEIKGKRNSVSLEGNADVLTELLNAQTKQYEQMQEHNQEVMKIRHDQKNFLIGIISELESGNVDATKKLLKEQLDTLKRPDKFDFNDIVSTVVKTKADYAGQHGIEIDFQYSGRKNTSSNMIKKFPQILHFWIKKGGIAHTIPPLSELYEISQPDGRQSPYPPPAWELPHSARRPA